uniref:SH3 domain-containing protein n=1 Tax=Branchiostoma floridae TaxID=7739 RepID=C3Z2U6_BRAFL|eukprot:XP_002597335.1 hypothetical protein BRAFLDRAFT_66473 [Branchiostoma floridae]
MYRALYDFKADDASALSFRVGQRFTLLNRSDAHWWEVTDDTGRVGYVPYNYLERDEDKATMYRALYDFKADDASALSFRVGQRFTLLNRSDAHWWEVTDDTGRVGYVPYNYLERDESAECGDIILSIDRGIEQVHMAAMNNGGTYTAQHREVLQFTNEASVHKKPQSSTGSNPSTGTNTEDSYQ